MQIVVNDLLTHYQKQGKGPVAIFLHGWGDSSQTFVPLISELKKNYTCISVDLPGFGLSQLPKTAWGIPQYAAFLKDFLAKTEADPELVFGHSNGGAIAVFALSHSLVEAKKLVLIASAGIRSEDSFKKSAYKVIAKASKQAVKLLPDSSQKKLRNRLYEAAGSDMLIVPELEETFKKVVGYDIENDARSVAQPTLLIYAQDDQATPPRYGDMLAAAIPRSRIEKLPSGGHFVHSTRTAEVIKYIQEFVK